MIEVRYERGVYLPQQNLWLDPWDAKTVRFCFSCAQRSHRAARRDHRFGTNRAFDAGASARANATNMSCHSASDERSADSMSRCCPPANFRLGPVLPRNRRRLAALHRRFQVAPRPIRRADGMAAGRHADHGNNLRPAALSVAADRRSDRSKSSLFAAMRSRTAPCRCCSAIR